jgi:hypothetical protein
MSNFKKIDERGIWALKSKLFVARISRTGLPEADAVWYLGVRKVSDTLLYEVAEFSSYYNLTSSVDGKAWTSDEEVLSRAEKLLEDLGYLDEERLDSKEIGPNYNITRKV